MSRRHLSDAEFRVLVDDIKDRHNLSDIVARRTKLKRRGAANMVGLCCFHQERSPSMEVCDAKGTFFCHGCGATGDIVRFVMLTENLSFVDALRWLGAADLPVVDPALRVKAAAEAEAERVAAIADARRFWDSSVPATGSLAERYCRSRGITAPLPASIRFGHVPAWRDEATGRWGRSFPAMLCAVMDGAGELTGLQRIFLRPDGGGKADMRKPKRSLGRVRGGALRLGPVASHIIVCEGPEDGLSLMQELPGESVWVALGTAMMPDMDLPAEVRTVTLAGDNNPAGRAAVAKAAEALMLRGLTVRTMWPVPGFSDFNDQLRGVTH
jgi:DNA primase